VIWCAHVNDGGHRTPSFGRMAYRAFFVVLSAKRVRNRRAAAAVSCGARTPAICAKQCAARLGNYGEIRGELYGLFAASK
jgi:hypothetical protein